MTEIAIIGGGATGVLNAIHLLDTFGARVRLTLFEPAERLGAGRAYATEDPAHLLNVPAERMSAYPADPAHFFNWLKREAPSVFASAHFPFVPRLYYRRYLQDSLAESEARAANAVFWLRERVTALSAEGVVTTAGGAHTFDAVIVATGYAPQASIDVLRAQGTIDPARLRADFSSFEEARATVGIVGTGLSAIDAFRQLRAVGHVGAIHFISRRGLFPIAHTKAKHGAPSFDLGLVGLSPAACVAKARRAHEEHDWATIADAIRPHTGKIWRAWTYAQRASFLRHAKTYWEIIRHRLPHSVHDELGAALASGQARVHRARIQSTRALGRKLQVRFATEEVELDYLHIAAGTKIDAAPFELAPGIAEACAFGFGFSDARPPIFFVGPLSKTKLWEITAVPDIRGQAQELARELRLRYSVAARGPRPAEVQLFD